MKKINSNRRNFIKASAFGAATFTILPSGTLYGQNKPSEQFRFAQIGCGGKGNADSKFTMEAGGKMVAMCDVDTERSKKVLQANPKVPLYDDYRVLLDKHDKDIDGVVISTPDHLHGVMALEAVKRGKHVYCQKPLARTYEECKVLLEAAKKYKVVTQMGNQGHSGAGLKLWEKMQADGAFGDILEVHSWSDRPIWPQGMSALPKAEKVPDNLKWDKWLGPHTSRDYSSAYLPFKWRGWADYGTGAIGDMAIHNVDPAFWIFELGLPNKVVAQSSSPVTVAYPEWSIIDFYFDKSPVTGKPMKITWYDGKKLPKLPAGCNPNLTLDGNGCMVTGTKMTALGGMQAARPLPIAITGQEYSKDVKDLEKHWRAESKKLESESHYAQWLNAAKAGDLDAPGSKFDYSAPFTQSLLLGAIALRYPGQELIWDHAKEKFSNHSEANQWLNFKPREGYSLSI